MYRFVLVLLAFAVSCASAPSAVSAAAAHNTRSPAELVGAHLRAVEAGDWKTAQSHLDPAFTMQM